MSLIGTKLTEVTPHDTTGTASKNHGFYVNLDGTLAIRLRNEAAGSHALPVLAGVFYPLDVQLFLATGTVTVTKVFVVPAADARIG